MYVNRAAVAGVVMIFPRDLLIDTTPTAIAKGISLTDADTLEHHTTVESRGRSLCPLYTITLMRLVHGWVVHCNAIMPQHREQTHA